MKDNNQNLDARRESGEPGGGQGRRDEVGHSPVYPVSAGKLPADDDAYIRTPGEFGQRGRGLEGYSDHGEGGIVAQPSGASEQGSGEGASASPESGPVPGAGEETAASGMVDVDQDGPADSTRF